MVGVIRAAQLNVALLHFLFIYLKSISISRFCTVRTSLLTLNWGSKFVFKPNFEMTRSSIKTTIIYQRILILKWTRCLILGWQCCNICRSCIIILVVSLCVLLSQGKVRFLKICFQLIYLSTGILIFCWLWTCICILGFSWQTAYSRLTENDTRFLVFLNHFFRILHILIWISSLSHCFHSIRVWSFLDYIMIAPNNELSFLHFRF